MDIHKLNLTLADIEVQLLHKIAILEGEHEDEMDDEDDEDEMDDEDEDECDCEEGEECDC